MRHLTPFLIAAALLLGGGASMVHVSQRSSPVWDEVNFYGIGAYYRLTGQLDVPGAFHPPLSYYLSSLTLDDPKLLRRFFDRLRPDEPAAALLSADPERGNSLLRFGGLERFLEARLPFILVYALLGAVVFLWSRRWFGDLAGLFSLALYLLCPSLMAHGFLITNDLLVGALLLSALFFLFLAFEAPGPGPLAGFLVCLAFAPTAKLLGLLAGPASALCVIGRAFAAREAVVWVPWSGQRSVSRRAFLGYWVAVGLVSALATWAALVLVYQGEFGLQTFRRNLDLISAQVQLGHPVFLDGERSRHGFVGYYARAIPYKTSLAVLLAWVLSGLVRGPQRRGGWSYLVALALAAILAISASGYTIGLRYVLVALPLLYVAAGRLAAVGAAPPWEARLRLGLCAAIVAGALVELAGVYPYPRAYVNRALVTGPKYRALADTDLDWGEGLLALREYVEDHRLDQIALSYHGAADPKVFGLRLAWYENPTTVDVAFQWPPRHGLFFVSSTNLSGLYFPEDRYAWLRRQEPSAVIGGTIYAFDLDRLPAGLVPAHP